MNKQREVIYGFRNEIINSDDVRDRLMDIIEEVVILKIEEFTAADAESAEWRVRPLADWVNLNFPLGMPEAEILKAAQSGKEEPVADSIYEGLSPAQFAVCNFISDNIRKAYELKVSFEEPDKLATVERYTILQAIDKLWQEHLYEMDSLRHSIGLRAHGQRDPLLEYKAEAFKIFDELMVNVKTEICHNVFRSASSLMAFENFLRNAPQQTLHRTPAALSAAPAPAPDKPKASDVVSEAANAAERRPRPRPNPSAPAPKSAATTRAPAAAARNTRTAAASNRRHVLRVWWENYSMKTIPWRALVWICLQVFISSLVTSLSAEEKIDAGRIHEIAAWLPAQPAGFAWPISDRAAWQNLAANPTFNHVIPDAAKLLAKPLPDQPDSLFLEFSQTGNRTHWQNIASRAARSHRAFHPGRGAGKSAAAFCPRWKKPSPRCARKKPGSCPRMTAAWSILTGATSLPISARPAWRRNWPRRTLCSATNFPRPRAN